MGKSVQPQFSCLQNKGEPLWSSWVANIRNPYGGVFVIREPGWPGGGGRGLLQPEGWKQLGLRKVGKVVFLQLTFTELPHYVPGHFKALGSSDEQSPGSLLSRSLG